MWQEQDIIEVRCFLRGDGLNVYSCLEVNETEFVA